MELTSLRYFICVAHHLNFSQAAKQLYISQPALSYHISNLEKELGTKLFLRKKNGLCLTEAGEILLAEAEAACKHIDHAYHRISSLIPSSEMALRMGFLDMLITPCYNKFLPGFLRKYPDINCSMERSDENMLLDGIGQEQKYDFIFIRKFIADQQKAKEHLSSRLILRDSFSVAVAENHPIADQEVISDISLLRGYPLLSVSRGRKGQSFDYRKNIYGCLLGRPSGLNIHDARSMDDLLGMVAAGAGIAIVPFYETVSCMFDGVKLIRLDSVKLNADVVLVWDHTSMTSVKRMFLEYMEQHFCL